MTKYWQEKKQRTKKGRKWRYEKENKHTTKEKESETETESEKRNFSWIDEKLTRW